MEKEFKIKVPDGYKIDKENSTFECIKFKPKENILPKTWEEYCKMHDSEGDKNLLPSVLYSKAMLALCQLIQLRDYYNDGWVPNWLDMSSDKHCILIACNDVTFITCAATQKVLAFKTAELRDEFAKNFKDLIETAKPLL